MRALVFIATLLATLPLGFVAPYASVLLWCWLSFMSPHQLIFLSGLPVVYMAAIVTAIGLIMSREPKRLPRGAAPWLLIFLMIWATVSTVFALDQNSWGPWNQTEKTLLLALTIMIVMTTRARIHALVWVIILSAAYFSLKGGIFVLATGGSYRVQGIDGTVTADNNNLGLVMVMSWPLLNYLRMNSESRWIRLGLMGLMGLTIFAVLGTYSRGAFLALLPTVGYFWWKSKQKLVIGVLGLIAVVPAIVYMPKAWVDRMSTIETYQQDGSAMGRLQQWEFAMKIARDRPLVGGGFDAAQNGTVIRNFYPTESVRAYHSIWFEALGDLGYPGLLTFIAIGAVGLRNANVIRRATRNRPELSWASDLAAMCQVSLAGYFLAGTFLSMTYYDVYYALIAILAVLRQLVLKPATAVDAGTAREAFIIPNPLKPEYVAAGKELPERRA
jgi:probable O-glycosylation ligase (exosortase A-associated)